MGQAGIAQRHILHQPLSRQLTYSLQCTRLAQGRPRAFRGQTGPPNPGRVLKVSCIVVQFVSILWRRSCTTIATSFIPRFIHVPIALNIWCSVRMHSWLLSAHAGRSCLTFEPKLCGKPQTILDLTSSLLSPVVQQPVGPLNVHGHDSRWQRLWTFAVNNAQLCFPLPRRLKKVPAPWKSSLSPSCVKLLRSQSLSLVP